MTEKTGEFFQEIDERTAKGERFTLQLTAREALKLNFMIRLALRDQEMDGLWKVTELAANIRQRIDQWMSETPVAAAAISEDREWERKYEPAYKRP